MRLSAGRCLVACAAVAATLACYVAFRFTRRVIIDVRSAGVWRPPLSGHDKTRLPERLVRTQPSVHAARCRFARRFASPAHRPLVTMLFIGDSTMRRAFETFCYSLSDGDVFGVLPETNRSSGVFSRQCRGVLGTQRIHAAVTASIVFNSSLVRTWLDFGWQPPTHVYVGSGPWLAWPIRSPFVGLHELAAWPTWWAWKRLEDQLHDTFDIVKAHQRALAQRTREARGLVRLHPRLEHEREDRLCPARGGTAHQPRSRLADFGGHPAPRCERTRLKATAPVLHGARSCGALRTRFVEPIDPRSVCAHAQPIGPVSQCFALLDSA